MKILAQVSSDTIPAIAQSGEGARCEEGFEVPGRERGSDLRAMPSENDNQLPTCSPLSPAETHPFAVH